MTTTDRRRSRHTVWIAATLTVALGAVARGAADETADQTGNETARAEQLFQKARDLMGSNDFATACPMLEEAYALDHGGGTLLALALCHEGAGRAATALGEYRKSLSIAVAANRPDRVMLAESHIQKLEAIVPRITAHLVLPEPAGLQLTLDGVPLDRASISAGVPVDPGKHELTATAPGIVPWRTTVDVLASARVTVVDVPAWTSLTVAPKRVVTRTTWPRTLGIAIAAAGLVVAGVGIYYGAAAFGAESDSKMACNGTECSPMGVRFNQDARHDALISDVTLSVGGVALVTGLALVIRWSLKPRAAKHGLHAWAEGSGLATSW